jgi:hypothetical protein
MAPLDLHWSLYPRTYVALQAPPFYLDGDLAKSVWQDIEWSEPFADITGNCEGAVAQTRFKAVWTETHLIIGALLEPLEGLATMAEFIHRNEPIYQRDSDFEVFVDWPGCNHYYKEVEINAINTVWNLMLDKPYLNGGAEHSGRIARPGDPLYYDMDKQETGTQVIEGRVNGAEGAKWSVELALSFDDLSVKLPVSMVIEPGTMLRINYSRVERQGKINWTWQPQVVWDTDSLQYKGQVNMHLPEAYGYIILGKDDASEYKDQRDPSWPVRLAAMNVYYAQVAYKQKQDVYASDMADLEAWLNKAIVEPFDVMIITADDRQGFVVEVSDGTRLAMVREDRFLTVETLEASSTTMVE